MILYFSATGNSKYAAVKIAEATGDKIYSLNDAMKRGVPEIDCEGGGQLGIVVPTFDWSVPWAVADYLRDVTLKNVPPYIFSVHTCGATSGVGANAMRRLLAEKNLELAASFSVKMPDTYVVMKAPETPDVQKRKLLDADATLDAIIRDAEERNHVTRMEGAVPETLQRIVSRLALPVQKNVRKFHTTDDCIGCGLCSRVCPQNIIEMKNRRPVWTENRCMSCFACMHRCPKHAIQRGRKTEGRSRYLNPNVKL